jgi:hypothetical protein
LPEQLLRLKLMNVHVTPSDALMLSRERQTIT